MKNNLKKEKRINKKLYYNINYINNYNVYNIIESIAIWLYCPAPIIYSLW